jgi:hypothetical protein
MPKNLVNIKLTEVSLVDKGANPGAHIVLMKSDHDAVSFNQAANQQEANERIWRMMDAFLTSVHSIQNDSEITNKAAAIRDSAAQFHAAVAELAKEHQLMSDQDDILAKNKEMVDTIAKQATDLEANGTTITKLTADLATAVAKANKLEAKINKANDNGDGFIKTDLPEAVQKKLDDQDAINKTNTDRIQKMEDDKLKGDWIGKCATAESGGVMFKVAKLDPKLADEVHSIVNAAEAQAKAAGLFKVAGDDGSGGENSALEKVNKLASDLIAKDSSMTKAVAVTKVLETNPELYGAYRAEMN